MDKKEVIAASVMLRLISFAPSPGWKSHLRAPERKSLVKQPDRPVAPE
jgi:hypothetical protein